MKPSPAVPRQFGFRQVEDTRDARFPLALALKAARGKKPRQRFYKVGPILDQGQTSSCVGHACKQLLASEPISQGEGLSPFTIYREARVIDEFPDDATEGTSVRAGLEVLRRRKLIASYLWAQNAEQAVDYILRIAPLVVGTDWKADMSVPDSKGIVSVSGASEGGHAYFAMGADLAEGTIQFVNSWGIEFGMGGMFSITIDDFDKLLRQGGVAAAVREK